MIGMLAGLLGVSRRRAVEDIHCQVQAQNDALIARSRSGTNAMLHMIGSGSGFGIHTGALERAKAEVTSKVEALLRCAYCGRKPTPGHDACQGCGARP